MNDRLSCALCGQQPCHCVEAECRACNGEGEVVRPGWTPPYNPVAESPADPPMVECEDCDGTGSIKCDGPRRDRCKFASPPGVLATPHHCYCEEAWERQQEDMASEPPPTARERQMAAQAERDALRGSR